MRTADLVEAEGRALHAVVVRLGAAGIATVCAALLSLAGLALIVLGLYWVLATALGPAGAFIILGALCLAISGGLLWLTRARLLP